MNSLKIIIPAAVAGGVADHARVLAQSLPLNTQLIELSESSLGKADIAHGDGVLLSYSGYGYHKHGAPAWLASWAEGVTRSVRFFGTIFHELYATSPPWRRAFWFSGAQKQVARRLARASTFVVTSRSGYWKWLKEAAASKPHFVAPVFSNVGELEKPGLWNGSSAVVFGSAAVRTALYVKYFDEIGDWLKQEKVELHDIGESLRGGLCTDLRKAGVLFHGRLAAAEVSQRLRRSGWGLLAYEPEFLAKSSIFAAYAAHGMCPVVLSGRSATQDGLRPGVHYLGIEHLYRRCDGTAPQEVAQAVHDWYRPHSIAEQSRIISKMVSGMGGAVNQA